MIDFDSGNYFLMKGVAGEIYDLIKIGQDIDEIKQSLLNEFEVDENECEKSLRDFLKRLKEYGFIELI